MHTLMWMLERRGRVGRIKSRRNHHYRCFYPIPSSSYLRFCSWGLCINPYSLTVLTKIDFLLIFFACLSSANLFSSYHRYALIQQSIFQLFTRFELFLALLFDGLYTLTLTKMSFSLSRWRMASIPAAQRLGYPSLWGSSTGNTRTTISTDPPQQHPII